MYINNESMQLFYTAKTDDEGGFLTPAESKHAVRVLRKKPGDSIQITDGKGKIITGLITDASPQKCVFKTLAAEEKPRRRDYKLHIALAPTKSIDRYEWFLEKAVEIGIDEITPVFTTNSERKRIKPERCERIILAAAKQSLNLHFPVFNQAVSFDDFITEQSGGAIAYCGDEQVKTEFARWLKKGSDQKNHTLLIGPEGDFTADEVKNAAQNGFEPVTLGTARLRTETAGVYACSITHVLQTLPL